MGYRTNFPISPAVLMNFDYSETPPRKYIRHPNGSSWPTPVSSSSLTRSSLSPPSLQCYEKDSDSIFKKPNTGDRSRILNEEHKRIILECVDEDPSIVLEQLLQRLEGLKASKMTLYRFMKTYATCH
ncbi:hypothetical protein BX666DRAFT_2030842 [Dichotomocladium elegans]|nr:hypothetical protein BX666DRAFT_2030842 [Dichotomocladium elegans]